MKRQVEQLNQFIMDFISIWITPTILDEEECINGVAPCGYERHVVTLLAVPAHVGG